ncbi:MAG: hypothetical protein KME17_04380 [Cyanosarcina radialis HA8281-LM2]|jgi:hypothetical protein|nr:hypothetical protein [Cyanosarcina radialis HA8281-LM2]
MARILHIDPTPRDERWRSLSERDRALAARSESLSNNMTANQNSIESLSLL